MRSPRSIRTPLRQHIRRLRYQLLPVLVFCACVTTVGWLWDIHASGGTVVGEVASVPIEIIPLTDGLLVSLPDGRNWQALDEVHRNDLLIKLDSGPAEATLRTMKSEVVGLRANLAAVKARLLDEFADRVDDRTTEARRLAVNVETLRLDVLDRQTRVKVDRIQLQRYAEKLVLLKKLVAEGVENDYTLSDETLRHDTLAEEIKQQTEALKEAINIRDTAVTRVEAHDAGGVDRELTVHLEPISKAIATQNLRVAELEDVIARLEIRSHVTGKIVAIMRRPGQSVRAGEAVMTIAPISSEHIISYVPENRPITPAVGMQVEIKVRTRPPQVALAKVDQVGPRVELIPPHQLRDPNIPQWGVPVRIPVPETLSVKPGQLVEVLFKPDN